MLLRNVRKSVLSCREVTGATVEECFACARDAAAALATARKAALADPEGDALNVTLEKLGRAATAHG